MKDWYRAPFTLYTIPMEHKFLDRLERATPWLSIPNLIFYIIVGQAVFYIADWTGLIDLTQMYLRPFLVLRGEIWRLFTFVLMPPLVGLPFFPAQLNPILVAITLIVYLNIGQTLESVWGSWRFTFFLLMNYLAVLIVSAVDLGSLSTNAYMFLNLFFAFAILFPNMEFRLFFILPVKAIYLAYFSGALLLWSFLMGDVFTKIIIAAHVFILALFFWPEIYYRLPRKLRKQRRTKKTEARHVCRVCKKTEETDPDLDFRYCPDCSPPACYCSDHLFNHTHRK
jgi:hypothetical protein